MRHKLLGLVMNKWSPQYYSRLRPFLILPGPTTTHALLRRIKCHTGLNDFLQKQLKQCAESMEEQDRYCAIMWDEMQLAYHVQYDKFADQVVGFEDYGYERTRKLADHVLVFTLRGIKTGWKLPIFYAFSDSQAPAPTLTRCLKIIVTALEETKLHLVATICDQASSNCAMIRKLIIASNSRRKAGQCSKCNS